MINFLLVLAGAALLYGGGEFLVRGSVSLARALGISPLVIGLTVVAFATSSPELFACLIAAIKGNPEMALGAVVGSNIANVGLILGLTVILLPLIATKHFIRREVPFMVFSGALLFPACYDNVIGRIEGLIALILLFVFLWYLIKKSREQKEHIPIEDEIESTPPNSLLAIVFIIGGLGLLVGGAHLLIEGASAIARAFGVPEKVIGLTLVAFGTSLPELASCVVAAVKKEGDLILGNIIGSNIFNTLCILGATTVIYPIHVDMSVIFIDLCVMLAITFSLMPLMWTQFKLQRFEGALLFAAYIIYVYYLFR
jgi:cation:H+ antiporter